MRKLTTLSFLMGVCLLFSCAKEEMTDLMPVTESSINQELEVDISMKNSLAVAPYQLQNGEHIDTENVKKFGNQPNSFSVAGNPSSQAPVPNNAPTPMPIFPWGDEPTGPGNEGQLSNVPMPNTIDHHHINPADYDPFPYGQTENGHP